MNGLNFTFAPPPKLVKSFFILGVLFYLISSVILLGLDLENISVLDPRSVGFAHLFLLGFVMSVIFGAVYQLISVVIEVPLFSDALAYAHLFLYAFGLIIFLLPLLHIEMFNFLGYGAVVLYISFLLYIANILLSITKVEKKEIKYYTIFFVHIALLIGVSYGLLASLGLIHAKLDLDTNYLVHSHIPLVLYVFVGGLIGIIATVLLPMFMLSHNFNKDISKILLRVLIIGAISAIFGWLIVVKITLFVAIYLLLFQLYDIFQKRLRKQIDIYAKDMMVSMVSLGILGLLLPFLSYDKVELLFIVILFFGFLNSFIVGHIYKIVPFLVWNEKFAPLVGKKKVPMLSQMVDDRLSTLEFNVKIALVIVAIIGVLFGSSILLLFTKILFVANAILLVLNLRYIFLYKG